MNLNENIGCLFVVYSLTPSILEIDFSEHLKQANFLAILFTKRARQRLEMKVKVERVKGEGA